MESGVEYSHSIVVPAYNALGYLQQTLPALLVLVEMNRGVELILVDNGSTDGTWDFVRAAEHPRFICLKRPDVRVGEVRNSGARLARGRILVFVDADCLIEGNYLEEIDKAFAESGAAAVGAYYSMSPSPNWLERSWHFLHAPSGSGFVRWVPAGNLAVRRDVFEAAGRFRSDLRSGEDVEFCRRLHDHGGRVYQSTGIISRHLGNAQRIMDFVRKHAWHGEAMLAVPGESRLSRPLLMTVGHWVLLAVSLAYTLTVRPGVLRSVLIIAAAGLAMPVITVGFRSVQKRRLINPVTGTVAYFLYYFARGLSLLRTIRLGA
jgi:glycosyltransferase involved in cell wall biosynthesis